MPLTPETPAHLPCGRCRTTSADAFDTPTSAICTPCWAAMTDRGASFTRWAAQTIAEARGSTRGPFSA